MDEGGRKKEEGRKQKERIGKGKRRGNEADATRNNEGMNRKEEGGRQTRKVQVSPTDQNIVSATASGPIPCSHAQTPPGVSWRVTSDTGIEWGEKHGCNQLIITS